MPKRKPGLDSIQLTAVASGLGDSLSLLRQLRKTVIGSYGDASATGTAFRAADAALANLMKELGAVSGAEVELPGLGSRSVPFTLADHRAAAVELHKIADTVSSVFVLIANAYGSSKTVARSAQSATNAISPLSLRLEDEVARENPHDREAYRVYSRQIDKRI